MARDYLNRKRAGKSRPSLSQTARDVRRQFALMLDDETQRLPSEKRFRDIIRGGS